MVPDSFFLLYIGGSFVKENIQLGPYSSFMEASTIGLEYIEISLKLHGLTPTPGSEVKTKIVECAVIDNIILPISDRGYDTYRI